MRDHLRLHFRPVGRSAAFFDLDKTVIAKSSALAFGRPFYRDGLISRRDVVKSAYAQLMFRLGGGTDEQAMARTRDYLAALCKGWRVEQVQQIVAETLDELINPYVYAEAAALIAEHQAAGRDVVLVSASGEEMVRPIGELLGITDVIATRMSIVDGRYSGEVEFYAAGPSKVVGVARAGRGARLRPGRVLRLLRLEQRPPAARVRSGIPARSTRTGPCAGPPWSTPGRSWSSATRSPWAGACGTARPSRSPPPPRGRRRRGDRHRHLRPAPPPRARVSREKSASTDRWLWSD